MRPELVTGLNWNADDLACVEGHQELKPTAYVGPLVDLAGVILLIVGERGGVDRQRCLQSELEHVVPRTPNVAARTKVEIPQARAARQQVFRA